MTDDCDMVEDDDAVRREALHELSRPEGGDRPGVAVIGTGRVDEIELIEGKCCILCAASLDTLGDDDASYEMLDDVPLDLGNSGPMLGEVWTLLPEAESEAKG